MLLENCFGKPVILLFSQWDFTKTVFLHGQETGAEDETVLAILLAAVRKFAIL